MFLGTALKESTGGKALIGLGPLQRYQTQTNRKYRIDALQE
jgi:hypothetical protein